MEGFKVVIVGGGSSHTPGIIQSLIENLERFARRLGNYASVAVEATGNTWMFCQVLKKYAGRLVGCG